MNPKNNIDEEELLERIQKYFEEPYVPPVPTRILNWIQKHDWVVTIVVSIIAALITAHVFIPKFLQ